MIERVLTIGAFGFDERGFVRALKDARADLFVDIRARRGVRGAEYAFVNAKRLEVLLADAGIAYVHVESLSASEKARAVQARVDDAAKVARRKRSKLSDAFVKLYERERMKTFSTKAFVSDVIGAAKRPVLFCVEREPAACHRSIVAGRMAGELAVPVTHLVP